MINEKVYKEYTETVVLLSNKKVDGYIDIELNL